MLCLVLLQILVELGEVYFKILIFKLGKSFYFLSRSRFLVIVAGTRGGK